MEIRVVTGNSGNYIDMARFFLAPKESNHNGHL
jgi:hypothetical protein